MHRQLRWLGAGATALVLAGYPLAATATSHGADQSNQRRVSHYVQHNLVADRPGHAASTDPNLVNPWGLSAGPTSPLWVSDNGKDVSTLYSGTNASTIATVPLVVTIPGGAPTGQVYNNTSDFVVPGTGNPAKFIFAGENGDISAWNSGTAAVRVVHTANAVYKGLALVHSPFGPLLLAANFHTNRVDVFNTAFHRLAVPALFRDKHIPKGYAPFNVATIGKRVFVAYARQDSARHDDSAGPGRGFIDTYTAYGTLLHRFVSHGDLNSPWALTLAPAKFGRFSKDLLVGNFGDGRIHAFNPANGHELGTLRRPNGAPIVIPGLWGLLVGNATAGGPNALWFSAGPGHESHGLLGTITVK